MSPERLRPVVVVLLVAAGVFVGLRRPRREGALPSLVGPINAAPPRHRDSRWPSSPTVVATIIALVLGAYDGFFGPGKGTFLIVAFSALLGDRLSHATADAKVVNFASNLAAASLFAARGAVLWRLALPMAAAQLTGGWLGAQLAVRRGDALVRRVVVLVALAVAAKLALDMR